MKEIVDQALSGATYRPFWLDSENAPKVEASFEGKATANLVVVGGGFTGLWAAILAKEENPSLDVVILEAGVVGFGASGRPGGIISTSVTHGLVNEARVFPEDVDTLERMGHENLEGFKEALERYGIDADVEWNGEMTVAVDPAHIPDLNEEYELHLKHGHNVVMLDRQQTLSQLKSPNFLAAMWSRDKSGIIHPAKLVWGLKAAAIKLGVRIFENSKMTDLFENDGGMQVSTERGDIYAQKVFLATNAWHAGQKDIKRRILIFRDHVLATEPLTDEQLARIGWENRQGIYDTKTQLNYMRLTKDNRIIFGGSVRYYFNGKLNPSEDFRPATYRSLVTTFYRTFPKLTDVKISHLWGGPIDYSMRYSVFFRQYFNNKVVYAGGYSGFGVAGTRFGASIGLKLLANNNSPEAKLAIASKPSGYIPPEPFRWFGAKITMAAVEGVDEKGGWRKAWIGLMKLVGFPL
ncbi:NAD(P)/FAD-dependent oxidoreductase [Pseudomonas sp. PB3P13]